MNNDTPQPCPTWEEQEELPEASVSAEELAHVGQPEELSNYQD